MYSLCDMDVTEAYRSGKSSRVPTWYVGHVGGLCYLNPTCGLIVAQHTLGHRRLGGVELYCSRRGNVCARMVNSFGMLTCLSGWGLGVDIVVWLLRMFTHIMRT